MDDYRFTHFDRELLGEDISFHGGPGPGDPLPDFDLPTTNGGRLRRADLLGRPALITFASVTCPMTASASPILRRLYDEYGGLVTFATVYVREAHPGERYPQPDDEARKLEHAVAYEARDEIPWRVAVDDVVGSFHRAMDSHTNAAWFVDTEGRVVFRSVWSNDEGALREGLEILVGNRTAERTERAARFLPLLRGLGVLDEVLEAAGPTARTDVRRAAAPLYGFARLARQFRPLSPLGRSVAAGLSILGVLALTAAGVARVARGRRGRSAGRERGRPALPPIAEQQGHLFSPQAAARIDRRRRPDPVTRFVVERAARR